MFIDAVTRYELFAPLSLHGPPDGGQDVGAQSPL